MEYIIYWAHLPEHKDITNEGYIGVTKRNLKDRIYDHMKSAKNGSTHIFHKAIRKYGSKIIWEVIGEGYFKKQAYFYEKFIRPEERIGWNTVKGGDGGNIINWTKEMKDSKSKSMVGNLNPNYGNKWSEERKLEQSNKLKGRFVGNKNPNYGNKWSEAAITKCSGENHHSFHKLKYPENFYLEIPFNKSNVELSKKFNISKSVIEVIKREFKKGRYNWLFEKHGITL